MKVHVPGDGQRSESEVARAQGTPYKDQMRGGGATSSNPTTTSEARTNPTHTAEKSSKPEDTDADQSGVDLLALVNGPGGLQETVASIITAKEMSSRREPGNDAGAKVAEDVTQSEEIVADLVSAALAAASSSSGDQESPEADDDRPGELSWDEPEDLLGEDPEDEDPPQPADLLPTEDAVEVYPDAEPDQSHAATRSKAGVKARPKTTDSWSFSQDSKAGGFTIEDPAEEDRALASGGATRDEKLEDAFPIEELVADEEPITSSMDTKLGRRGGTTGSSGTHKSRTRRDVSGSQGPERLAERVTDTGADTTVQITSDMAWDMLGGSDKGATAVLVAQ